MKSKYALLIYQIDIVKNATLGRCGETRNEMKFEVGHKL